MLMATETMLALHRTIAEERRALARARVRRQRPVRKGRIVSTRAAEAS